jgi:2-polyprenyl-3-methyl-5-hydroxy-6-metoxy-1,4-benzoquinol methylase
LSREAEKAHYDLHQNSPDDQDYRQFLSRLTSPLTAVLTSGGRGLDFGSGPGPTLSVMLEEAGFDMAIYDIFYANNMSVLQSEYDFVTTTEVVEHLSEPGKVLESLYSMIRPGGYLGVMTKMVLDQGAFNSWHYKNDQTHISFYSRETFNYLAQTWGASVEYPDSDVVLIKKPNK